MLCLSAFFRSIPQRGFRMVKSDLGKLDRLTEVFYEKALAGDVQSGVLTVKLWERKHELLGLNSAARVDLQILTQPQEAPSSFEKIRAAIMAVARSGNGDGAVDALSAPDDTELSH